MIRIISKNTLSDTKSGLEEIVQVRECEGWFRDGEFVEGTYDQQNRWLQKLSIFVDEGGRRACEIKPDKGMRLHQLLGLCPVCHQGAIRLTVIDGQLRFQCFNTQKYPNPCLSKFYWGNYGTSQVICGIESVESPDWVAKIKILPMEKQKGFDFGKIVEDGKKKFYICFLERC